MESKNLTPKRYFGIDIMKIMAAFMVTFYHFQRIDYGFTAGEFYLPNLNRLLMNLCVVSVPLFFMCNGAILLNKEYPPKKIWGKALKIVLLLLVWNWLSFPEWFFRTLCILYVCYPVLKYAMDKGRWLLYAICLGLMAVPFGLNLLTMLLKLVPETVMIAGLNLSEMGNTGMFTLYGILYFLLGGMLIKQRLPIWLSILMVVAGFGLSTLEGVVYTNYYNAIYDGVNSSFPTVGALIMSVGVFDLLMRTRTPNQPGWLFRAVTFVSKNILGIYLFHLAITLQIKTYMTGTAYPTILILGLCALIDGACVLICALIRKIPYSRELVTI